MTGRLELTAGSIDITPPLPVPLGGYIQRSGPFERISDPLEIDGVLLRSAEAAVLVLSGDLLYFGARVEAAAREAFPDALVLAAATHTHFAPNVDGSKPLLGPCDHDYCELVESRVRELVERLATDPPIPVAIRYGKGRARLSTNRRHRRRRGPTDPSVHLLRFDDADGRARAIVWSYACHPVGFPDRRAVTADFPGVVRRRLRESDATLPVLYLQGFSGDLRPPRKAAFTEWSESLAAVVTGIATAEVRPALSYDTLTIPVAELIDGYTGDQDLRAIRLRIADDLQLVALSAEVVVGYTRHLPGRTIPVGCVGDVYGYLPTARMLAQGGYEVEEFFAPFSLTGRFRDSLETRVVSMLRALA